MVNAESRQKDIQAVWVTGLANRKLVTASTGYKKRRRIQSMAPLEQYLIERNAETALARSAAA